ncbi:MAG: type I-B CRISPR-associated protein Cas7/Csh2 [Spirochaetes bacterium]|nr:MAG: type I-B CRISPR-associated protein Cas7/Csh2 [Spirochaetota bacterium]
MSEIVKNRSEILFLYDATDANPNGDPVDENKPRIDEETRVNIVTDVRLKRTVRDYLHDFKNCEILIREIEYGTGIQDAKIRAEDFLYQKKKSGEKEKVDKSKITLQQMVKTIQNNILEECIDVRLFGVTLPVNKGPKEESSITYTGPVQFKFGRSLHQVDLTFIKGTGAFASEAGAQQKTFREEYILPYSLIAFYGIVNENAAKETLLKDNDIVLLLEGIWIGTRNLISRSKAGQVPRLLIQVIYKENQNFHIGELDRRISKISNKDDKAIRSISDIKIDITNLVKTLNEHKDKIEKIRFKVDERIAFIKDGADISFETILNNFSTEELSF